MSEADFKGRRNNDGLSFVVDVDADDRIRCSEKIGRKRRIFFSLVVVDVS